MTSYLVTGGSGYFGALVVARLHAAGHTVRVLDLNDADDRPSDVEFVQGDLVDLATVKAAVQGVDCIFHDAALASVPRSVVTGARGSATTVGSGTR